jgi:hypothetical protein
MESNISKFQIPLKEVRIKATALQAVLPMVNYLKFIATITVSPVLASGNCRSQQDCQQAFVSLDIYLSPSVYTE